jgi:ubiquinone/menaquinone biosynthesis C-methylase UbiE
MARIESFELFPGRYDAWYEENRHVYLSELEAIRSFVPISGTGMEIGVGSGRFAVPLKIKFGVEPSSSMRALAFKKGITAVAGIGEALPFQSSHFDFILMTTTICFLDNAQTAIKEAHRVLKPDGRLIIGFVDKNSEIGKSYQKNKNQSVFYQDAIFYSTDEVINYLNQTGFKNYQYVQTLFKPLKNIQAIEPIKEGHGNGSFVVVCSIK